MRRHTKCENIILLTIELEIDRVVALVAVKDEKAILTFRTRFRMNIEMFNPIYANCIRSPSVITHGDPPIRR